MDRAELLKLVTKIIRHTSDHYIKQGWAKNTYEDILKIFKTQVAQSHEGGTFYNYGWYESDSKGVSVKDKHWNNEMLFRWEEITREIFKTEEQLSLF